MKDLAAQDRGFVWESIEHVVDELEVELEAFEADVEDRVLTRIEAAGCELSPLLRRALGQGVRAAVRDALGRLRTRGRLPHELPPELIELARLQAASSCDRREFADVWLVGQEVFWTRFELIAEQVLADEAHCWAVTKRARLQLSGHAARLSELYLSILEIELARGTGDVVDTRLQTEVSRALDGKWVDPADLRYDLGHHHVAVVADAAVAVEALAVHTGREYLLVAAPGGARWGWLGGHSPVSDSELDAIIAWQRSREDGPVAFGEPAAGIAGFATSHRQALEARAIAVETGQRVVRFADLQLIAAVLRDRQLAKGFVERELGDLEHPGERTRELRATLRAYLEHGQSIVATAALRRRDRKTIMRQLRTAEALIDHTVSDRSDELLIALRIAEILHNRG